MKTDPEALKARRPEAKTTSTTPVPSTKSPMAPKLRYIARRKMLVGDRWVMPGDEVPEAAEWPNVAVLIRSKDLDLVDADVTIEYIAGRKLKVGERTVYPGDGVPEAAEWPNLSVYISTGQIIERSVQR